MISNLLVVAVLTVFTSGTAAAQHHANRGLQVGLKFGISSYNGDINVRRKFERNFDATYEAELFYRIDRRIGIGLKQSIGDYPELSAQGSRRSSTAVAVRSYLLKTRVAPYVQVGASRTSGGTGAGYGIAFAAGFELEISRYFALYQDISFDQVLPDKALDGVTGGRKFDLFGRVGIGLRFNLVRSRNSLFLSDVERPDSLTVGELNQFRAVLDGRDESDLAFTWNLPDGLVYRHNPIYHSFSNAGTYEIQLTVASAVELIREKFVVTVGNPLAPPDTLSNPEVLVADESPIAVETLTLLENRPAAEIPPVAEALAEEDLLSIADTLLVVETSTDIKALLGTETRMADAGTPVVDDALQPADTLQVTGASSVADTSKTGNNEAIQIDSDIPGEPNAFSNVVAQPSRFRFNAGDFAWVVETVASESEAANGTDRYKYLALPFGYERDPSTGQFYVLVGQFVSAKIANIASRRIQSHAPRAIWLYEVK